MMKRHHAESDGLTSVGEQPQAAASASPHPGTGVRIPDRPAAVMSRYPMHIPPLAAPCREGVHDGGRVRRPDRQGQTDPARHQHVPPGCLRGLRRRFIPHTPFSRRGRRRAVRRKFLITQTCHRPRSRDRTAGAATDIRERFFMPSHGWKIIVFVYNRFVF